MNYVIPVLDMQSYLQGSQEDKQSFIHELHTACYEIGFFYLENHTISPQVMSGVLDLAKQFFALPQQQKDRLSINAATYYRGYGRLEAEKTYGIGDYKETYDLGLERSPHPLRRQNKCLQLIGPNQWPDPMVLPTFKESILHYIEQLQRLSHELLSLMVDSLKLAPINLQGSALSYFKPEEDDAHAMLRLLHYPASLQNKLGVGEHVDSGFLSLLLQDDVGGLQIKNRAGQWVDVLPKPDCFIVNIGEMLQSFSRGNYQATLHRVKNHPTRDRVSAPFFFEPNLSSSIAGLDGVNESNIYGEYLLRIFERSFP